MSNIINGHDIGMGYEKATVRGPGVQMLLHGRWTASVDPNYEIKAGVLHRRPLPIISQHPGAIPLEPGDELIEGECYLMRDGRLTGPMPYDGHEAFPFGVDGTPDTWRRDGCCWKNSLSHNDIVARLPKVETVDGKHEPMPEPEKAKEEKVKEYPPTIGVIDVSGFVQTITVEQLAKAAQLPEVIAEVERQRAEKEIKVGDWFWTKSGTPDRAHAIGIANPEVLGQTDKWHKAQDCTKITNPDFIALLEKGAQP